MLMELLPGIAVVALSGLIMGTSPWPLKLMRRFQYEQFGVISMLVALVLLPWLVTLLACPEPFAALREVDGVAVGKAIGFAFCWGVAQVLAMICFGRLGVSLTYGILCSVGGAVGVMLPMVFKASGVFADAPDLWSKPGLIVMIGAAIMVVGVIFASLAGANREKSRNAETGNSQQAKLAGNFALGIVMVIAAGVLSVGWGSAFTYSQSAIIKAMTAHGAGEFAAGIAVWAVAWIGAAIPNVLYPIILLTKNKSWGVLLTRPGDIGLSIIYGILFFASSVALGKGMLMLGNFGAALGWGIAQSTLILGGQALGFISGEWRGIEGQPRRQIYAAIVFLLIAMIVMACAKAGS
jgi:hypothetical protein